MRSPAKYLFDDDFAASAERKSPAALAEHAAKLAEAEATGYRNGFAAAKAEAEQRSAAALERIAAALGDLSRGLSAIEARLETEAVEVASAVAKKLAPELIGREPYAEMAALVADCFRHLVAAPHVVVRVNDALHDGAREKLEDLARNSDTRLVVLAEPDIAPGDCRIEWADGGIKRDSAAITAAIDEAVARYIAARRIGAGAATSTAIPDVAWRAER
jgi:flagellar assembly protein FliH